MWLSDVRVEPFDTYGAVLQAAGVAEPFPHAYDSGPLKMSVSDVERTFVAAGFADVLVVTEGLELAWASPEAMALGITGTPYGPAVKALDGDGQRRVMAALRESMTGPGGVAVRHVMTEVLGRGTAR